MCQSGWQGKGLSGVWANGRNCYGKKDFCIMVKGRCGSNRMVVGFTTTYAISAYHCTDVVSSNLDQGEVYNIM